jgi:hypothetical protein
MRRVLVWLPLASLLSSVAAAQIAAPPFGPDEEPDVVPSAVDVERTSYHVPVFTNELVTVLNVFIPPHRESGYHRHYLNSVGVLLSDTARTGQLPGAEPTVTAPRGRGSVNFTNYGDNPLVHNVVITGDTPFHNIVVEVLDEPGGFNVETRGQPYAQILDNEHVRVWRLVLEPGETAPVISQTAPGIRVVIDGGELVEGARGSHERSMAPRSGEFFWQERGEERAVRNVGTTRIELVEIELK